GPGTGIAGVQRAAGLRVNCSAGGRLERVYRDRRPGDLERTGHPAANVPDIGSAATGVGHTVDTRPERAPDRPEREPGHPEREPGPPERAPERPEREPGRREEFTDGHTPPDANHPDSCTPDIGDIGRAGTRVVRTVDAHAERAPVHSERAPGLP